MLIRYIALILVTFQISVVAAQNNCSFRIGKLKYGGGGDWYANPSSGPNFLKFVRSNTRMNVCLNEDLVEPGSAQLFQYPFVYLTGHGNIEFSESEAQNLRKYLLSGGFLLLDDNYGLNKFAKRAMKKVFPEYEFVEVPFNHPVYHKHATFPEGIPKIHEHDGKPAQLFGIFHEGRMVCALTYETDLGDGWEDPEVHNNPEEVRRKAFLMGVNLLQYAIEN